MFSYLSQYMVNNEHVIVTICITQSRADKENALPPFIISKVEVTSLRHLSMQM